MPERAVQLIILPHRPVKSEAEIDANLDGPISILLRYVVFTYPLCL